MDILGINRRSNPYTIPPKTADTSKSEAAGSTQAPRTDTVSIGERDGAAYYKELSKQYECVKNGSVSISGAYLDRCARDPEKAQELEENLSLFSGCVRSGYENALARAQADGGKLLSYSETWSIDSNGNITSTACSTVEYETGTKSWKEINEETIARLKKKREEAKAAGGKKSENAKKSEESEEAGDAEENSGGKVAVNEGKRARQIAAAATKEQVQQVLALLQKDMSDCKAGLEKGWCDESEIAKVEALLSMAKSRLSQVPAASETEPSFGLDAFAMASLM